MSKHELTLDNVLKLISNKTRREILRNLARGNKYILQLTEDIKAPQQSIIRHLKTLEDQGIVEAYKKKSEAGGPPRKYYKNNRSFLVSIDLTSHSFTQRLVFPENFDDMELSEEIDLDRIKELSKINLDEENLASLSSYLFEINSEISKAERWREYLVSLRQTFLNAAKTLIEKHAQMDIEKDALYLLIGKKGLNKENISETLDIREKRVDSIFDNLKERAIVQKSRDKKWDFSSRNK